ncbi:T9SS-dependent choice-of-anchor J family protein [Flavobacterium urocaniciphilum]|uniref:Por secretion system C-terminal sorting domain-containing protein n=1 Tax=Flavobacterium urocaniciphilum TaxID=1299341 RepID=A0A1H9DAY3_9FLAO|nr:choice-of-anchor J domain-containing protein [Flavobacterium urocaniciphilum]SEQ10477.1 Por secretion system C-terminal sorting domain-containing protein [Flavobacterium urocaniciphilum]
MKKITFWLFALFTSMQITAQVSGYTFTEGAGAYAALGGTNITATGDDGTQNGLPIGFTFKYGGVDFTTFSVTTNGWIRLGGNIPGSGWTNDATNFASANFRPLIAALWDDNHRNTGAITYSVTGSAPNQILTVDYNAVNIGGSGSTSGTNLANYQIKLYETTNVIEFHYGTLATAGALTATIGLSDVSGYQCVTPGAPGTSSSTVQNHNITAVTNIANKMYRFTPPSCSAPSGLNSSAVTATTATIGWNPATPAPTGYEYVVSTTNTTPAGAGTATTNLSEPISSLLPQTTYYVFVRSNCGGTFSSWNSFSFMTLCAPISAFPHLEPFNTFLPNTCWMNGLNGDTTAGPASFAASGWGADGLANNGATGAIRNNIYTTGANDWVISPEFSIPATGYELKFDAAAVQWNGTNAPTTPWESDDFIEVLVSSTGTTNWTVLHTYNDTNQPGITATPLTLDLDAYSGQTVRFAFRAVEGATDGGADIDFSIDNFEVRLSPTCPDLMGLTVGIVTATTVEYSWNDMSSGGATGYEYAVTTSATPPASGTAIATIFNTTSSLTPQTVYYLHVRAACSGSTFGNWSTTTFTTGCAAITALPHLEPFNTFLPNACWMNGVNGDLTAGPAAFTASGWGADGLANNGTTGAIRNNIFMTGANDWVISPEFSIPTTGYELKFDAAAVQYNGTGVPTTPWESDDFIEVLVSSTGTDNWIVLHTYNDTNQPGITATPLALDLDAYSGQTVRFAFRAVEGATDGAADIDFSIDNFEVRLSPTCPDLMGLTVGTVTATTVDYSWNDMSGGGAIGYEYAITTSATPPASGTAISAIFNSTSSLNPQTVYYLHVRSTCSGSTYGNWSTTTFTTLCAPVASLPWIENFDSVTTPAIPQCWLEENGGYETSNGTTYNTPHSGANYLRDAWSATNEFMWTPGFDLVAGTSYDFSSWIQGDGDDTWRVDFFVNSSQSSTGATQLGAQYVVPGTGTIAIQPYAQVTRSFVPSTSGTYYFAFRVNEPSGGPWYVAFDDVEVKLSPTLPPACASNLVATPNACGNFANNLTWDATASANGYYVSVGTTPGGTDVANAVNVGTNSYSFSGTVSTTYYWKVVPYNGAGSATGCTEQSFTTSATGCYCPSVPTSNDGTGITSAVVGATTNPIADVTYVDLTAVPEMVAQGANTNVQLTFSTGYTYDINIWIDFNNDFDFDDAGELVKTGIACTAVQPNTVDASFTMPLTAPTGPHRMRIGTADDGQVPPNPCYGGAYGVTLDFVVDTVLGSSSFNASNFVAYPNPVKDILNLSYSSTINNVRVVNLLGQEVLKSNYNANDVQVNLSSLSAGTYIVNITVEDTVHSIKVIKE